MPKPDRVYGRLTNVDRPAAQDIYTVTDTAGGEHMLPAVPEFVKKYRHRCAQNSGDAHRGHVHRGRQRRRGLNRCALTL